MLFPRPRRRKRLRRQILDGWHFEAIFEFFVRTLDRCISETVYRREFCLVSYYLYENGKKSILRLLRVSKWFRTYSTESERSIPL
jgi:hypothetical protein